MARRVAASSRATSSSRRSATRSRSSTRALQFRNPVMFIVELGSVITTVIFFLELARGHYGQLWFVGVIAFWLWLTVLFANFAEAIAEGRGKAQADALRATRTTTTAHRRPDSGRLEDVPAPELQTRRRRRRLGRRDHPGRRRDHRGRRLGRRVGDHRRVGSGHPRVGRRPLGRHGRHEAALRPARRPGHAGAGPVVPRPDDRARRGRRAPQDAERDRAQHPARRADDHVPRRRRDAAAVRDLRGHADLADRPHRAARRADPDHDRRAALGDRHRRAWTGWCSATCSRCPAARSRRRATSTCSCSTRPARSRSATARRRSSCPSTASRETELAEAAQLSSLADETPEGRSIVVLAKERYGLRGREVGEHEATFIPFSATTRMSGVDMDGKKLRKGAADAVKRFVEEQGGHAPARLDEEVDKIARAGGTPLVVAQDNFVLGVIHLKDIVKGGMSERFDELRRMGIRTVMITGDNRVTAAVIAQEAGVDDFLAEATPEAKMALIKEEQAKGRMVAMTGDGTNDAPGARPVRRRRRHERRHLRRQGGRQHGRPRQQPDEADRGRRGREAAADHARRADDVLDRERRRQVLRDPAGDVRLHLRDEARRARPARLAQHHAPGNAEERDRLGDHLQRADHPGARPAGAAEASSTARSARPRSSGATCSSTGSAA